MELQRINDKVYNFKNKNGKTVSIQIASKYTPEYNYNLALKAAKIIFETDTNIANKRYKFAERKWKIEEAGKVSRFLKFLSLLMDFFHPPGEDGIIRYKVSSTFIAPKKAAKEKRSTKELRRKKYLKKSLKDPAIRANFKSYIAQSKRKVTKNSISAYKQGIRATVPISSKILNFDQPFFKDPFTELATIAWQKFEGEFTSKDYFTPDDCQYKIIKIGKHLHLVHETVQTKPEHSSEAIALYKKYLSKNFDKKKLAYIEHLYRLKLDEISVLTPEHIYRINIGLTNLEYQDYDDFLAKLPSIEKDIKDKNDKDSLKQYLKEHPLLTGKEAKGLFSYLNALKKHPQLKDLKKLLAALSPLPQTSKELSSTLFNEFLPIIGFSEQEREKALTGRKIFGYIKSGYSTAGLSEYKAWVDQHQLTQFFSELINSSSIHSYAEKLAHVVSKIHLAREHPTEGFRIGALIPGPHEPGKVQRWYKVTSCVSNGYGIFSFTLEDASADNSLPAIKLYRSTASARYALHSKSTVVNDLNNFNSPGHQGIGRTDKYEEKFFKDRTIPVWLGYTLMAQHNVDSNQLVKALISLEKVGKELRLELQNKHKVKNLKEIIRSHDFLLNDLERKLHPVSCLAAIAGCTKFSKKWQYAKIFQKLIKTYILKIEPKTKLGEKQDAKQLVAILKMFYKIETSDNTKKQIKALIRDIQKNILTEKAKERQNKAQDRFDKKIGYKLDKLMDEAKEAMHLSQSDVAIEKMNKLIEGYYQFANKQGESLSSKISEDISFVGHSLGGACAATHVVHWFSEKNRMPIPNFEDEGNPSKCSVFVFDDPATNKASNRYFIGWGNKHHKLFKFANVKFEIIRRHEAGDFVVTAGEEHLGAVYSEEEERQVYKWLRFDAAVLKKYLNSKHYPIALPLTAHEIRFLDGKRIKSFYNRDEILKQESIWKAKRAKLPNNASLSELEAIIRLKKKNRSKKAFALLQAFIEKTNDKEKALDPLKAILAKQKEELSLDKNDLKKLKSIIKKIKIAELALSQIREMLEEPGDYFATSYSAFIQGIFNRKGNFKDRTAAEKREFEKQSYELKIKVWNLKYFMDKDTAEGARKSVSLFWTIIRKLLVSGNDTYHLDPQYNDSMGNFAVGENGVLTKQNIQAA